MTNGNGSVAIEFTALAIPFSLLIFAILESCNSFAGQQVMANATDDIARRIRTGQIRPADLDSPAKLEKLVCDRLEIIVADDCPGLEVDLREYTSFADAASARFKITEGDIVLTKNGAVDSTGFIEDIGVPSSTIVNPSVGLSVAKSGRTTGFTTGSISSINTSVNIQYQRGCGSGRKFTVSYTNHRASSEHAWGLNSNQLQFNPTGMTAVILTAGT